MTSTGFALSLGPNEFFWIFLIFLILFGATALPRLFRSLGKSVREFKKASEGLSDEMDKAAREDEPGAGDGSDRGRGRCRPPGAAPDGDGENGPRHG